MRRRSLTTEHLLASERENDRCAGYIIGQASMGDEHVFCLSEFIDMHCGSHDPRRRYAYRIFRTDGTELWAWDRDPLRHPDMPDHEHVNGKKNRRQPRSVSLDEAMKLAWDISSGDLSTAFRAGGPGG